MESLPRNCYNPRISKPTLCESLTFSPLTGPLQCIDWGSGFMMKLNVAAANEGMPLPYLTQVWPARLHKTYLVACSGVSTESIRPVPQEKHLLGKSSRAGQHESPQRASWYKSGRPAGDPPESALRFLRLTPGQAGQVLKAAVAIHI